jgi:predicted ferric reductase
MFNTIDDLRNSRAIIREFWEKYTEIGETLNSQDMFVMSILNRMTEINDAFQSIRNIYKTTKFPSVIAIALIALLYLMLMFPYLIQVRNTKSTYTFWGRTKGSETSISFEADEHVQDTPKRVKGSTRNSFTI